MPNHESKEDIRGCATVYHPLSEIPEPEPYMPDDPNPDPHLSFEINPKALMIPGYVSTYIHYDTKVCVANAENCFGVGPVSTRYKHNLNLKKAGALLIHFEI